MDPSDFVATLKRIMDELGLHTQLDLAQELGITQGAVSDSIIRKTIPATWLLTLLMKYRLNPAWVLYGDEGKYMWASDKFPEGVCEDNIFVTKSEV